MNKLRIQFTLALLTGWISSIAQIGNPCCSDATCVYCDDVALCSNLPGFPDASIATAGGTEVCGTDLPNPIACSSFSENNYLGGICVSSCNDEEACNYFPGSPDASQCYYPDECEDCDGACLNDVNANDICDCFETAGCTDATACNYNAGAALDDGSCTYPEEGFNCDGSCIDLDGDGVCQFDEVLGCTDSLALNYYPIFTEDDGGCIYLSDFEPECPIDCPDECPADVNTDGLVTVSDILLVLATFDLACPE